MTGLLTDTVSILAPNGSEVATWTLPEGSIPRRVHFDEALSLIYVYCWGTNKIEVHFLAPGLPKLVGLDLGYDPTSADRKRGREIFFDGANSLRGNISCYSCHIEVEADFLSWNIEDDPIDRKRVMRTQSLKGIAPTGPYHWRGERQFVDFNPAFDGLLGGKQLSPEEFADFRSYVFGVENPANPFEHPQRIITNDTALTRFDMFSFPITTTFLDAVAGQDTYFDELTVGTATCQDCHTLPTGTDNDFFIDGAFDTGHCNTFVVPAYNGLWRKEQRQRVTVQEKGRAPELRAPLGTGTTHAGLINGLFEFVVETGFSVPVVDRENIALFMHQIDQGLAPAVHQAKRSWAGVPSQLWLEGYLMPQAEARNCDIAVFGTVDVGAGPEHVRWYWDRRSQVFLPDDSAFSPQSLGFFIAQAMAGTGDNLFVGLPVGMAERWAIDYDADELNNAAERTAGLDPNDPDWDDDGFLDGTEVAFGGNAKEVTVAPVPTTDPKITRLSAIYTTARVAKFIVETNVPTTLEVDYTSNHGDSGSLSLARLAKNHTILLRNLDPSNLLMGIDEIYNGTIRVFDEFGVTAEAALPTTTTEPFVSAAQDPNLVPLEVIARQLDLISVKSRGFQPVKKKTKFHLGYDFEYEVRIDDRRLASPSPLGNHVVIARVHVNRKPVAAADLLMNGGPPAPFIITELGVNFLYGGFGGFGPFVVSTVSDASGISRLSFSLLAAAPGDEVTLSLEVIGQPFEPNAFLQTIPILALHSLFDLPNTPAAFRSHTVKL